MSESLRAFHHETPPRTMGSETEYTTRLAFAVADIVNPKLVVAQNSPQDVILANGGRLYRDFGAVLEYATPECHNGHEVALYEKAGERTVRAMGDELIELVDDGEITSLLTPVYKRTGYAPVTLPSAYDDESYLAIRDDMSTGHHETYQTGLGESYLDPGSDSRRFLDTYLATRIIWTGAGLVGEEGYHISQKAGAIDFEGNGLTEHGHKIPHRHQGHGLLEIRTGEGNMSEWAIRTKFDFTSLVLRLIEHGEIPRDLLCYRGFETTAMQAISINPTAKLPLLGDNLNAIETQQRIVRRALDFAEKHPDIPKQEIVAAEEVRKTCEDLEQYFFAGEDISVLSDRVDWAAKLHKLHSRRLKLGDITCRNLIAVYHDLKWEDTAANSTSERWYAKRQASGFTDGDIRRAMRTPPRGHAARRIELLRHHAGKVQRVDWNIVRLNNGTALSVYPTNAEN